MSTRYEAVRALEPGKPVKVLERDERGFLVGAWIGYWNFKRGTVTLYPDVRNRYVNWPGGRIPDQKRQISDRFVHVRESATVRERGNSTSSARQSLPPSPQGGRLNEGAARGEGYEGDGRRSRKAPLEGQESMNFK